MSAQDYYEPLEIIEKINKPGAFGNEATYIETGKMIQGAIGTLSKRERLIAEAKGVEAKYVVTTDFTQSLKFGTIVKRANGQYLIMATDERDDKPPGISTFDWWQRFANSFTMPK